MTEEIRPLTDLVLDPDNARRRTERSSWMIGRSLERFGPLRSLVGYRTEDGKIMIKAGNGTYVEAGQLEGIEGVQVVERKRNLLTVVVADDLSDDEWDEYGVADNRTSDLGEMDVPTLAKINRKVPLKDWYVPEEIEKWTTPDGQAKPPRQAKEIECECPNCGCEFTKLLG